MLRKGLPLLIVLVLLPGLVVGQDLIRYYPPAGLSTLSSPILMTHTTDTHLLQFDGPDYGDFFFRTTDFPNGTDPRNDRVYRFGYNVGSGGGLVVNTEAAMALEWETHWEQGATRLLEFHIAAYPPTAAGGGTIRPFSFSLDKATGTLSTSLTAHSMTLYNAANSLATFAFTNMSALDVYNSVAAAGQIRGDTNNRGWLQQINAARSAYINLVYLNSADTVMLGEDSANLKGVEATRKLSYAMKADVIADSGGAGAATLTLSPTLSYHRIDCQDADGCDITMGETSLRAGTIVVLTNLNANVCNFADSSGVSELAGAFAMGQYDTLQLLYGGTGSGGDRWIEISRSNN